MIGSLADRVRLAGEAGRRPSWSSPSPTRSRPAGTAELATRVLVDALRAKVVVVGADFRFGPGRR